MELATVVDDFDQLARKYFEIIENGPADRLEWLAEVEAVLAELYAAALHLPNTNPTDSSPPAAERGGQRQLMERVSDKVGKDFDYYRFVFDPFADGDEPVGSTIADDLVSVYEDLHEGTDLVDATAAHEDAVWEWRFGFRSHWGRHALGALFALYASQLTLSR